MDMRLVGGAALALGTAVTAGVIARPLFYDRSNVSPEEIDRRRSKLGAEVNNIKEVAPAVLGIMGGVGAGVYAFSKLGSAAGGGGALAAGLGVAALGGALLGSVVGGLLGGSQGKAAREAKYGETLSQQTDTFFKKYDVDNSGKLEVATGGGRLPEYLDANGSSIQRATTAADANGDEVVTKGEWITLLEGFDKDKSGKLSSNERFEIASKYGTYG